MVKDRDTAFKYSSFVLLYVTLWNRAVCLCTHMCTRVRARVRGALGQIPGSEPFPSFSSSGTAAILRHELRRMLALQGLETSAL